MLLEPDISTAGAFGKRSSHDSLSHDSSLFWFFFCCSNRNPFAHSEAGVRRITSCHVLKHDVKNHNSGCGNTPADRWIPAAVRRSVCLCSVRWQMRSLSAEALCVYTPQLKSYPAWRVTLGVNNDKPNSRSVDWAGFGLSSFPVWFPRFFKIAAHHTVPGFLNRPCDR